MQNKFIVIEGLEGAGKSTVCKFIVSFFRENGIDDIILTREPGGTPVAEQLRRIVKQSINTTNNEIISNEAELLIFYAARIQLVKNVIQPALNRGTWVISDRHDLSSQAYQGGGREMNEQLIMMLKNLVLNNFQPDLTLYLDVTPEIGLHRVRKTQPYKKFDRIEQESLEFFKRTRERYLKLAANNEKIITIDATRKLPDVFLTLKAILHNWLFKENKQ